jgi:hypothetical protein
MVPALVALSSGFLFLTAPIFLLSIFQLSTAQALQYQRVPVDPGPAVLVSLRGPIVPGDFDRFVNFLGAMPSTDRIMGLALDSPGGNVIEAEKMAQAIKGLDTSILVVEGSQCSSACFLLFASGSRRFVHSDALIGVHSVSEGGKETVGSMALTTAMARDLAELGVSDEVIGKLVQTPPGRATWLTPSDLASMGVTVVDAATSNASPEEAEPRVSPPLQSFASPPPLRSAPPDQPRVSKSYAEGLAARRAWEEWFEGLTGAFKDGAEYWASQRSLQQPGSCYGIGGLRRGDWTAGCTAAQQALGYPDIRRTSDPDYRAGWNSY